MNQCGNLFNCDWTGSSVLCGLFSSRSEQGYSVVVVRRLLAAVASLVSVHRLWACRHQQLQHEGSEHRLSSRGAGLVVPRHVGSPWIRDRTHVSCIGRWILYRGATREALYIYFEITFWKSLSLLSLTNDIIAHIASKH